jgi:hypothetical protein
VAVISVVVGSPDITFAARVLKNNIAECKENLRS